MLDHKGFKAINGNRCQVYFLLQTSFPILMSSQNPHNPIAKDWKLTKCVLSHEKKTANLWWFNLQKIIFFPGGNRSRIRLGWAIFEGSAFSPFEWGSFSAHPSVPEGCLCIICYQERPCCFKGTWCVKNTCWMSQFGSEFQLLHSLCSRQREYSALD